MIGDRWGVTDSEILRCYPCDDFVVSPCTVPELDFGALTCDFAARHGGA
jgi:hypothetical protein